MAKSEDKLQAVSDWTYGIIMLVVMAAMALHFGLLLVEVFYGAMQNRTVLTITIASLLALVYWLGRKIERLDKRMIKLEQTIADKQFLENHPEFESLITSYTK